MKFLSIAVIFIFTITSSPAQKASTELEPLLNSYYEVKNALVNADAMTASAKASEFMKASNSVDLKTIGTYKLDIFNTLQKKLVSDAERITASKDINKQRDFFAGFSLNFYSLAKMVKLSGEPVYQAYCPMKKMYWLSSEQMIRNPYYGKTKLTCGSITDTINP